MADNRTKEQRSYNMSRIKSKNTSLELSVRKKLHSQGFRYTLGNSHLPGRPDIALPKYKTVVFVNGCFWHRCSKCSPKTPQSNFEFWQKKFNSNIRRDWENKEKLEKMGWEVVMLWECEIKRDIDSAIANVSFIVQKKLTQLAEASKSA